MKTIKTIVKCVYTGDKKQDETVKIPDPSEKTVAKILEENEVKND